jgi:hypothetical protein
MILPMALILLVVASLIVVPGTMVMQSLMKINSGVEQDAMAYYAADAGVADLIWKYKYGTAPTSSYILTGINNMSVDVSLLPQSTGQNYFWRASAPAGSSSKAQVFVNLQQSGSQGNNVFDQAVASLNGNITMGGTTSVTSDDDYIIAYCDSSWTSSYSTVTCSRVTSPRETGVFYDKGYSVRMVMTNAAADGNLAYYNTGTKDISPYSKISLWIQSTVALTSGDLQFKIATDTGLMGTVQSIDIPSMPANTGTRVMLTVSGPAGYSALKSIGIYKARPKGAFTLYIDNVVATNNISHGDVYANGSISLSYGPVITGDVTAMGTISDPGSGIKGLETPNSPASWTPQPININNYKNEANIKGGTVYDSLSTGYTTSNLGQITVNHDMHINWSSYPVTMGPAWIGGDLDISGDNITMGPVYVGGDLHITGASKVTLKGTVYVEGDISIANGTYVQGGYAIVGHSVALSGGSTTIAKGNVPFIIAYDGDVDIANGAIASGVVYAPNGEAHLSGGVSLYGAVVARSVRMENSSSVIYMTGIQNLTWPAGWGLGGGPAGGGGTATTTLLGYDYR